MGSTSSGIGPHNVQHQRPREPCAEVDQLRGCEQRASPLRPAFTSFPLDSMTSVLLPQHGIAARIFSPFTFVVVGAAIALIITFVVLIFAWRTPRFATVSVPLPRFTKVVDQPAVRWAGRLLILAAYAIAALAAIAGQDRLTNPIFGFVFVWMWVGLVPISLLLGWFWRATNPPGPCTPASVHWHASTPEPGW